MIFLTIFIFIYEKENVTFFELNPEFNQNDAILVFFLFSFFLPWNVVISA